MSDLGALLSPARVAVIGASRRAGGPSSALFDGFEQWGYEGELVAVNPSAEPIRGRRTVARLADIAEPVDVAFLLVPASATVASLEECAAHGVGLAVVGSAGFAEDRDAEGARRQDAIAELVARSGMRVIGPNSQGFLNVAARVPATFSPSVWTTSLATARPDVAPADLTAVAAGNVAVLAQSGGLGFSLFNRGVARGIGFSHVVSTGNEVDVDVQDLVEWLVDDPATDVVGIYLEGLQRPERFAPLLAKAQRSGTRLVVAKVGRSPAGRRAALGHTGHLAGDDEAFDALFRRYGVVRVDDPDELLDAAAALSLCPLPSSRGVGVVSASGGSAVWLSDALSAAGLDVPVLSPETQARVAEVLPSFATVDNPVDITGAATVGAADALERIADDPAIGTLVLATTIARVARLEADRPALERVVAGAGKPVLVYSYTEPAPASRALLRDMGLPVYTGLRGTARAAAALARAASAPPPEPVDDHGAREAIDLLVAGGEGPRREHEVKGALRRMGVTVPNGTLCVDADAAHAAALALGAPVAVKIQSRQVAHKARVGGVALGCDAEAARVAAEAMLRDVPARVEGAVIDGVLVEAMAPPGVEVIVGVENDSGLGPMVVVGWGGSLVEIIDRSAVLPAPLTPVDARDLFAAIGLDRAVDAELLGELGSLVVAVSRLAWTARHELAELELNPVIVDPATGAAVVADAFAAVRESR
jgi:acyl-CoA synthetase (NDP forming)